MADKKISDTLEEQRRAREEYIKLKKMQSGELEAGAKPSEEAVVLKTPWEKFKNYWYHNKVFIIVGVFAVAVAIVLLIQLINKPRYDYEIVYFSYRQAADAQLDLVEEYFEEVGSDLNGDGVVNISIVNCSFYNEDLQSTYRNQQLTKMQAIISADKRAMLYITDQSSIEFFNDLEIAENIFESEPVALDAEFYEKTKDPQMGYLTKGLQVSYRRLKGTNLENSDNADLYYQEAKRVVEALKK